ncbi:MAG: glycosyltransferase family 4 protein [Candidatus Tyrphobacter sp.]
MRILLLTRHIHGGSVVPIERGGGTETFISSFLELPSKLGNLEITVVAPRPAGEPAPDPTGVHSHYFSSAPLVELLFVFRNARNAAANIILFFAMGFSLAGNALRLTRGQRHDVIYAVGGPIAGLAGILVKLRRALPLVMHFHWAYAFSESSGLTRLLARAFYDRADQLIGNCPTFAADAIAIGISARKCAWALNWVDQDFFRPRADRAELRKRYGLAPSDTAFLFVGRFDWTKHVDRIIQALTNFNPRGAVFLFAGSGELQPALEALQEARADIRILGTAERSALAELYNACDIQLWGAMDCDYPSLVVMEALSSGLPVVTSSETFNHFYVGRPVDGDIIGVPNCARLYPATQYGIRKAISDALSQRNDWNARRGDIASFAHARFGFRNAVRLVELITNPTRAGAGA